LATLDRQNRVRNEQNADGFAPGEGAGFVLLTTVEIARKHDLSPLARVVGCAAGEEPGHIYSDEEYRGEGLAGAFAALFATLNDAPPVRCVYASLNGERYWAKELGVAVIRCREHFADDYQMEHPVECFGDVGAASGPLILGLAALGIAAGYRPSPALLYCSSDYGARAVALLDAA
jgi:3-oxoacyl-[acyl-carrier-protein] synthase-1